MERQTVIEIADPSQIGEARRSARAMAEDVGLDETARGAVAVVATEAATNILKHATRGEIVLRGTNDRAPLLDLLALDRGPGIADVARARQDGYSTAGSPGTGLGAMARLSSKLELYTRAGRGTAILARFGADAPPGPLRLGAVCLPHPGETVAGDAWEVQGGNERTVVMLADGLGHGPLAAAAAQAAVDVFRAHADEPASEILNRAHLALRATRGAAVAIAEVDVAAGELQFAGIGNIAAVIVADGGSRQLASMNGTVGLEARTVRTFTYPWTARSTLVMASDGLTTRWSPSEYPGLFGGEPTLSAGALYRDHSRRRDDVTVVVLTPRAEDRR
jgi:anti-sigma regulatory factor (Ser/Thr protein kinase)